MKLKIWILVVLAVTGPSAAQNETAPLEERLAALEERLRVAEGRERYEALVDLADFFFKEGQMIKITGPGEEALELLASFPDPDRELVLKKALLHGYAYRRELDRALEIGLQAEALARSTGTPADRAFVARRLGDVYRYRSEYDLALDRYDEAQTLYEELEDDVRLGHVLNNIGIIYGRRAMYAEAVDRYLLARAAYERGDDLIGVALTSHNLATYYLELGRTDEALTSLKDAIVKFTAANNPSRLADSLHTLGAFYVDQNDPQRALSPLRQAFDLFQMQERRSRIALVHLSLGDAWMLLGDDTRALEHYESSFAMANEIDAPVLRARAWQSIAHVYSGRGQPDRAAEFLERSSAVFREHGDLELLTPALADLAATYSAVGRYHEAFDTLKEHTTLQNETWNAEARSAVAEMQSRFEAQEKEKEIALLKKDQALQNLELERQNVWRNGLIVGFAGFLIILALLFNRYRLKVRTARMRDSIAQERKLNIQLREIDRLKDEFLANTSHELRTPLYGIIGLAESLCTRADIDLPAPARGQLETIIGSARRLERLVGDILDFSKIKQGQLELVPQPLDLRSVVDAVLVLVRPLAHGKRLTLKNAVPEVLPPAFADEQRLEQILLNLLANAVKFTEAGEVEISAQAMGERILIAVRDTGIGIAPEHQKRIFRAFEQADGSAERLYGGTGLGLAVSRQLVELHGGKLEVESVPGEGSMFSFSLPVATGEAIPVSHVAPALLADGEAPPVETAVESISATPSGSRTGRILVVDDEPVNRMVLRQQLLTAGHEVCEAADGFQALERLNGVDLVLLDVMMPRMSGYEVCRKLRQRYPPSVLPVIFVTAKDRPENIAEGFATGGNDYLTKPVGKEELQARIAIHLELLAGYHHLKRLVAELEARNIELARFNDAVAHDLRNPLVTLKNFLGLAERDLDAGSSDQVGKDLASLGTAIHQMERRVDALFRYSAIGSQRLASAPVEMSELIREALHHIAGPITRRGVEVVVSEPLPPIIGDRVLLLELFEELLANAVKFPGGSPSPRIEITAQEEEDEATFIVRDNGAGIDPAYHERIFRLFEQLDPAAEGSGLGLAMARRIVEEHGGRIRVESEGPERGAAFLVSLPGHG